jgi:hypothetical protein
MEHKPEFIKIKDRPDLDGESDFADLFYENETSKSFLNKLIKEKGQSIDKKSLDVLFDLVALLGEIPEVYKKKFLIKGDFDKTSASLNSKITAKLEELSNLNPDLYKEVLNSNNYEEKKDDMHNIASVRSN